jgi:hypothetical protein
VGVYSSSSSSVYCKYILNISAKLANFRLIRWSYEASDSAVGSFLSRYCAADMHMFGFGVCWVNFLVPARGSLRYICFAE